MGRVTRQIDYAFDNSAGYDRTLTYNAKGQVTYENIERKQWDGNSWDLYTDQITSQYGSGANYALGAVTQTELR